MNVCAYYGCFEVSDKTGRNFKRINYDDLPAYVIKELRHAIEDYRATRKGVTYGSGMVMFAPFVDNVTVIICSHYIIRSKMHNLARHGKFKDKDGKVYRFTVFPKDINEHFEANFIKSVSEYPYALKRGVLGDLDLVGADDEEDDDD